MKCTRKKTKVIGIEEYTNKDGEIVPMQVMSIEERDFNFHKIWIGHIVSALDIIGNQKIRLVNFILENLDAQNKLVMTQRKLAKEAGISLFTVQETIKALQEADFLVKINSGAYQVNPNVIFKGGSNQRMNVLIQYQKVKAEDEEDL